MPPITTCMQQSRQAVGASDILQISFQSESRLQQHGVISAVPYMSGFIFRFAVFLDQHLGLDAQKCHKYRSSNICSKLLKDESYQPECLPISKHP